MKFINSLSLGVAFATVFTVTTAAPISTSIAARDARYVAMARSIEELDARDPFSFGSFFKAIAPIAKPFVAKIPKVGGFLSKFLKRDGTVDEDLLKDFLVAEALAGRGDIAARSLAEDLVARDPFSFGSFFKAIAPIAKPFVAKIPKVGGILSKFFKRDGTVDEELLNDWLVAQALAGQSGVAARSLSADLEARDPFSFGNFFKAIAPIAKPFVEKIPKVGGFLSKFFKRDGTIDEELLNDFIVSQALASRSVVARSSDETADELIASALISELTNDVGVATRSLEELDAREPFSIPAPVVAAIIQHGPAVIKAVAPVAKKAVSAIGKFFGGLFRRGEDLNDDDVAGLIAELVADLKPALSRRDTANAEAAWNDFVNAIVDAQ